jgi:hypothetical protein
MGPENLDLLRPCCLSHQPHNSMDCGGQVRQGTYCQGNNNGALRQWPPVAYSQPLWMHIGNGMKRNMLKRGVPAKRWGVAPAEKSHTAHYLPTSRLFECGIRMMRLAMEYYPQPNSVSIEASAMRHFTRPTV